MCRPKPSISQPSSRPHPREDLHRFVNELNVRYNVGILIPDPAINPANRKDTASAAARIYRRLETHFYRGGLEDLHALLRNFDHEAKAFWSQWVQKPQGDPDTLPRTTNPPLAANLVERDWLQKLLNDVLDKTQSAMPAPRTFGRSQSGPAGFGAPSALTSTVVSSDDPSSTQAKRRADVEIGDASKRTKADPIKDLTASATCRQWPTGASAPRAAVVAPSTTRTQSFRSITSASTSTTSFHSATFSVSGDPPVTTQDTVEASSQELHRPDLKPSGSFSQGSLVSAPSSATQEALNISFIEFEARLPQASLSAHHLERGDARTVVHTGKDTEIYSLLQCIWRTWSFAYFCV